MCPTVVVIYVTELCINNIINYVAVTFVLFLGSLFSISRGPALFRPSLYSK